MVQAWLRGRETVTIATLTEFSSVSEGRDLSWRRGLPLQTNVLNESEDIGIDREKEKNKNNTEELEK